MPSAADVAPKTHTRDAKTPDALVRGPRDSLSSCCRLRRPSCDLLRSGRVQATPLTGEHECSTDKDGPTADARRHDDVRSCEGESLSLCSWRARRGRVGS